MLYIIHVDTQEIHTFELFEDEEKLISVTDAGDEGEASRKDYLAFISWMWKYKEDRSVVSTEGRVVTSRIEIREDAPTLRLP